MPQTKPIFPGVKLSRKDEPMRAALQSWGKLNELFVLDSMGEVELKKLILLECEGKQRPSILGRLVARLISVQRKELLAKLQA